nr:replication protein [Avon-Heathcote Estuary associated circular virus 25]
MAKENRFRLQCRKLFLTYPHCTASIQEVYDLIHSKKEVKFARICIEPHSDGTPHIHAAIHFAKKVNICNARLFDINDHHCNMESVKNWPATLNYCKKGDNWQDFDNDDDPDKPIDDDLFELAETMPAKEYWEYCRRKKVPFAYASNALRGKKSMFTITDSTNYGIIREDLGAYTITEDAPANLTSTVLVGPSGIGKTSWALRESQKPALLVTHLDALRQLDGSHKSIIFDDMSFTHIPREAQIHLVDRFQPRQIHVRYGTADIPAGIQKIFTANQYPFVADPAIDRRVNNKNLY